MTDADKTHWKELDQMEQAGLPGHRLWTCIDRKQFRWLLDMIQSQAAEIERLLTMRCPQPLVSHCAKQWEADYQRRHLEECGLADEFPFGCDSIQYVAESLLACRKERDGLKAELAAYRRDIANFTGAAEARCSGGTGGAAPEDGGASSSDIIFYGSNGADGGFKKE